MTNEEARSYFINCNEKIISVAKDENIYNYETQQVEDVFARRTFEANELAIKALDQELKTGHWIGGDGHYICSCCRRDPEYFLEPLGLDGGSYMAIPMDYCPHCGAKMVEPQEGGDQE